ncbi:iron-sulfur cluster repair di-iron protein [Mixta theicola]|uniref:Iron-sulfur cluster repair di-iron protein n=1 Tax=Mixta theicola TaxID=1458355 RepID=A0A2K1QET6_9GAMM|nr:iron-sulfur cluster repair protein YtfE [Mixta theicola]PNS13548.1 iron-sulfur cluster repair di-iron protein [Mixta theicola]GLR09869.1 iron-sulfur cluster repair protein YtfE [Mixta theicola]
MSLRTTTLGELAIAIPGSTALFHKYDLDFCCGGKHTLEEMAAKRGLEIGQLEQELQQLTQQKSEEENWLNAPLSALIEHIINRYHNVHRQQLPDLITMAEKVERVHGAKSACPHGLASTIQAVWQHLSEHMMKEERVLFPMIEQGLGAHAGNPIAVMEFEHNEAGEQLEIIKSLTNNLTPPEGACTTWRALYSGIDQFIKDLMQHIHLENNLLFPRALRGE